jgi:hypothetical protein
MLGAFELGSSSVGSSEAGSTGPAGITGVSAVNLDAYTQTAEGTVSGVGANTGSSNVSLSAYSQSAAGLVTTPTIAGEAIKTPSGSLLASTTIPKVAFVRVSDMANVLNLSNQITDASGLLPISSTSFVPGTAYIRLLSDATGANVGAKTFTAAP